MTTIIGVKEKIISDERGDERGDEREEEQDSFFDIIINMDSGDEKWKEKLCKIKLKELYEKLDDLKREIEIIEELKDSYLFI